MLLDEFLPVYDISDSVAAVVEADVAATWDALMRVDLMEVGRRRPLAAALGALRAVPDVISHLSRGERPPKPPDHPRWHDTPAPPQPETGWILLGERPRDEIAFGLVGRFWLPVITFAPVTPASFRDFAEPDYAKSIYAVSVRPAGDGRTLLAATMRTLAANEHARRWLRRYWTCDMLQSLS